MSEVRTRRVVELRGPRARGLRVITYKPRPGTDDISDYENGSGIIASGRTREESEAIFEERLRRALAEGYVVVSDTRTNVKMPAVKRGAAGAEAQFDELLQRWRDDGYDNFKDAILDARSALLKARKSSPTYVPRLERMLRAASTELAKMIVEDVTMVGYARGLLDPTWVAPSVWKRMAAKLEPKPSPRKAPKKRGAAERAPRPKKKAAKKSTTAKPKARSRRRP